MTAAPRPYHHPNLRLALLTAALRLVRERGPAGVTLREVARRAGVSHNAPYRHFRNKEDLIATVAAQGFRELTASMVERARDRETALERLRGAGIGYLYFALRRPAHFTVMFDLGVPKGHPEAESEATRAFETLLGYIGECQGEGSLPADQEKQRLGLWAWSLVHGIAKLAIAGRLPFRSKLAVLEFAESAMQWSFSAK